MIPSAVSSLDTAISDNIDIRMRSSVPRGLEREPAPRLLVISQVYVPDPAAVGQHIADVAEAMVQRGWLVDVYTSARGYDDPSARYPRRERRRGVGIRRLPLSSFGKRSIIVRLAAQVLFLIQAAIRAFVMKRPDVLLVSTSPPFAGFFGAVISAIRRVPMVWWVMDINPDQMVVAGKLTPRSVLVRAFDWMNRVTLRRAAAVVTLDDFMAETLRRKVDVASTITVLPPWSHNTIADAGTTTSNTFRDTHQLQNRFVVMYAGNHAIQHPLDTLLDAARALEADERFVFVFAGGGAGKAVVAERLANNARNIVSLPYQPLEQLGDVLAAADVHVVSMGNDMVGIVHPCKIYAALTAARPVLAFAPEHSHIGLILHGSHAGWRLSHGDVEATVATLRHLAALSNDERRAIGSAAAHLACTQCASQALIDALCKIITTSRSLTDVNQ